MRSLFPGHPAGLASLFFTELWERMSFYGMRALLVLFLVDSVAHGGLGLNDRTATAIYGLYMGATFIACLPGGWVGDRLLGGQLAVLLGGIVIACGHLLLGLAASSALFFTGLLVIVLGTGLLKPNASAIVAQLYPEGGARRDAGFTIYYIGINVGATIGPLITGWLSVRYGWSYGFMAAAVGMTIGVLQYQWTRPLLGQAGRIASASAAGGDAGHAPGVSGRWRGALVLVLLALGALSALIWNGRLHISAPAMRAISTQGVLAIAVLYFAYLLFAGGLDRAERARVLIVIVLFVASVMFWAGFEQAGSSLNLFAERHTARALLGLAVPSSWLQALEPIFIVAFGPLFSALWLWLGRRNRDPSTPFKFILGLLGMGLGFLVMAAAARAVVSGQRAGMGWLTLTYLLHTWGELCLSPVGMSAVSKLVPRRFVGQSLGVWFVSISLGELIGGAIAGNIGAAQPAAMSQQFMRIFWFAALCAAGVALCTPLLRRWAGGVK